MKVLHLNLKKQWFGMVESNEKTEEYRALSPYWCSRFFLVRSKGEYAKKPLTWWEAMRHDARGIMALLAERSIVFAELPMCVAFSNGYAKDRPQTVKRLTRIEVGAGREAWGAKPGVLYFVLTLKPY